MKLIISLYFICHLSIASVIVIGHQGNLNHANIIKSIFINKYKIPSSLINIQEHCEIKNKKIVICIDGENNFEVLQKNKELLSSLQIFNRPF